MKNETENRAVQKMALLMVLITLIFVKLDEFINRIRKVVLA
jgi:hypothetical protein